MFNNLIIFNNEPFRYQMDNFRSEYNFQRVNFVNKVNYTKIDLSTSNSFNKAYF